MKTLKTLVSETKSLARYAEKQMVHEISEAWLWSSQNAFLTETNPATGIKWKDRYGSVYGRDFKETGNIEPYLSYGKLHRTGRLLRGLHVKHTGSTITLYNNVPYASEHELGSIASVGTVIKGPYVRGGAKSVMTGSSIYARPFMQPSKQVLRAPLRLMQVKMRSFGW